MKKKRLILGISLLVFLLSFFCALLFGAESVPLSALFGNGNKFQNIILWDLRLPRALLAALTGVLLGGSGAVFQLFFRNPLAEPGIMGISSGATLGAVIATLIGGAVAGAEAATAGGAAATTVAGTVTAGVGTAAGTGAGIGNGFLKGLFDFISPINLAAFLGALGAGALVTFLAFSKAGRRSTIMLLLCGTALGTLYSSISSLLILTTDKEFHSIYTWILGSFNGRGWKELLFIALPSTISIVIMFCISGALDLLSCGETSASSLGVEVHKIRILVLISGALAVSAAVCAGGTIGFIGLIAPHIVRKIVGPKSKILIPFSMIFGAILLLLSDTLARVIIAPAELPTGIITSILGVPFFISLCLKEK